MVRLVRTSTGSARVDPTGREAGRGAYLCDQPVCWDSALRRGTLARALKLSALNQDDVQTLTTFASEHVRMPVSALTDLPPAVFERLTTQGAS